MLRLQADTSSIYSSTQSSSFAGKKRGTISFSTMSDLIEFALSSYSLAISVCNLI